MEEYYDKNKSFNYKLVGWSIIGIVVLFLILFLNKKIENTSVPETKKINVDSFTIIDSTWVEFPNTITKTTPRYFNRTESGKIFYTNYKRYKKGDTIDFILLKN